MGLILCELVTNIQRHAYPDRQTGAAKVRLTGSGTTAHLVVEDYGIGFDTDLVESAESVGLTLISGLVAQIGGTLECQSNTSGTRWTISFMARATALNDRASLHSDAPQFAFAPRNARPGLT